MGVPLNPPQFRTAEAALWGDAITQEMEKRVCLPKIVVFLAARFKADGNAQWVMVTHTAE